MYFTYNKNTSNKHNTSQKMDFRSCQYWLMIRKGNYSRNCSWIWAKKLNNAIRKMKACLYVCNTYYISLVLFRRYFSNIPTHATTSSRGWSIYTAEIIVIFPCPRKSFTFSRRRCFHFVANGQEKIGVFSIPKILLQPICKPKWHIFKLCLKTLSKVFYM